MTNEELILERLDRLETAIVPVTDSARSIRDLRDDLAPRVSEAVQALITELADVEADFQLEDLLHLIKKGMRNVNNLSFTLDQLKNLIDFALTAEPLLKCTVPQVIFYLDDLEQKGIFRMLNKGLEVMKKISASFSDDDMDQIGDGVVRLMGTLKKLTAPEALDFLDKAADIPAAVDVSGAKNRGLFGLMGAMGEPEVKEGMGIAIELTKGLTALKASG